MKLGSFFVIGFCSLSLLFVGLDPAQNTKGIQMHIINEPIETFCRLIHWAKQCAWSWFVQPKSKQLCRPLLKFVELHNISYDQTLKSNFLGSISDQPEKIDILLLDKLMKSVSVKARTSFVGLIRKVYALFKSIYSARKPEN